MVKRAALGVLGLLGVLMMLAAACGGDDVPPTLTRAAPTATSEATAAAPPTDTVAPTATTAPPPDTATPPAPGVRLEISVDGDNLVFDASNLEVPAGAEVVLVFDNVSTINQHNWVLVTPGNKDDVALRGTLAGPDNDWVEPGDSEILNHTKLLDPGETGDVSFAAPPPGTYQFVCTFPGHNLTMFGEFVVTP